MDRKFEAKRDYVLTQQLMTKVVNLKKKKKKKKEGRKDGWMEGKKRSQRPLS